MQIDPALAAWLRSGAGRGAACERVIETSISWVWLYGDFALKLKKPLDLGFLDFTTPEKRHWAAAREIAFNRLNAPDIYRGVRAVTREGRATFALDGAGAVVDWAVDMARFDERAVLSERSEAIDLDFAERMGRKIARFHIEAARGAAGGGAAGLRAVLGSNARQLRSLSAVLDNHAVEDLIARSAGALAKIAPLLDRRLGGGFVRCCHGDLHLGNILARGGDAVLFDCIEFNDAYREIDILYDLAFLLMDLDFRGQRAAANRVLNAWLDEAARAFDTTHWDGLAALALFQSARAAVRAHVKGREGDIAAARAYLLAARTALGAPAPALVAVGGLSGTGKTTFARALAPRLGLAPGAVVLRSDEVRKRLFGLAPTDKLPHDSYTETASRTLYREMMAAVDRCLASGCSVVVDAAFLDPLERAQAEAAAAAAGVAFHGVWLETPVAVMQERLKARRGDASDADTRVLALQLARDVGPVTWAKAGSTDMTATVERVAARLGLAAI